MEFVILFFFFVIGTFFWSFSTVLIERWRHKQWGIMFGRSECPNCKKQLTIGSLMPVISYLIQRWKCSHCGKSISLFYPIAESVMGMIFLLVWYFILNHDFDLFSLTTLILLVLGFITGVYMLYDGKYREIPDQVMIPGIYGYLGLLIYVTFLGWDTSLIFDIITYTSKEELFYDHILALWVLYTFFFLQIFIPWCLFLGKKWRYKDILGLILSYITFPFALIFDWKRKEWEWEKEEDIPAWIGWWDLRVAIFIGITLGLVHGVLAVFFAYIIGSVVWIFLLSQKKTKGNSEISFWPFLGIGWIIALLLHTEIITYFYY